MRIARVLCHGAAGLLAALTASAQGPLIADGMITPTGATTSSDIVVVQLRTADEKPGPPLILEEPTRILLSTQKLTSSGDSPIGVVEHPLGRLPAGPWQVYSYDVEWNGVSAGAIPRFGGVSGPATFFVTRGEVFPKSPQPRATEAFELVVEGDWTEPCPPAVDRVRTPNGQVIVDLRATNCSEQPAPRAQIHLEATVPPLGSGRYAVEVRWPDASGVASYEVFAATSFTVAPRNDPLVEEVRLEADPAREGHRISVHVRSPNYPAGRGCASWEVRARNAWVHGRDLYAQLATRQIAAVCDTDTVHTFELPLPDLESGLYRVLVVREQASAPGSPQFWAQSPLLVEARQLAELIGGRFRVEATWRDHFGNTGRGVPAARAESLSAGDSSSAIFYFFSDGNWELLVKVLDGCAINDRYWVFASASTDVEYTLTVEDTVSGARATYQNPLGRAAPAITDTSALAGCE